MLQQELLRLHLRELRLRYSLVDHSRQAVKDLRWGGLDSFEPKLTFYIRIVKLNYKQPAQ